MQGTEMREPGWYLDRDDPRRLRWWDGHQWDDRRGPKVGVRTGWRRWFPPFLAVPITLVICAAVLAWAIERAREFGLL
jgi:hypothetical protein